MILADKIISQRRKNGWSQEELAEKVGVSRQAVSKWESAQSVPDLNKIITMAELFGVTTDYLLKESIDDVQYSDNDDILPVLTLKEAQEFLALRLDASRQIANAIMLMILSIVPLFLIVAAAEDGLLPLDEDRAGAIGLIIAVLIVALAVGMLITTGSKSKEFDYMKHVPFDPEYGVKGLAKEQRKAYRSDYSRKNLIGVMLCILAIVPIFAANLIYSGDLFSIKSMAIFSLMFVFAGLGVRFLVSAGIVWASFDCILEEGDYTRVKKKRTPLITALSTIYWLISTAIYLAWSFATDDWSFTWVLWPISGVMFAVVMAVTEYILDHKKEIADA